ncbi:MAG: hypothetical protein ABJF65_00235 [Reichenbachiella sp.]|uniref:hypothetical protein n=1 Tax=Reichenbachiella sp. TaxID=2184521 RepID=UPI00326704E1
MNSKLYYKFYLQDLDADAVQLNPHMVSLYTKKKLEKVKLENDGNIEWRFSIHMPVSSVDEMYRIEKAFKHAIILCQEKEDPFDK